VTKEICCPVNSRFTIYSAKIIALQEKAILRRQYKLGEPRGFSRGLLFPFFDLLYSLLQGYFNNGPHWGVIQAAARVLDCFGVNEFCPLRVYTLVFNRYMFHSAYAYKRDLFKF
jgi:hypothetical protein